MILAALLASAVALLQGCESSRYYWQAAKGHFTLLRKRTPVADLIADASTADKLREMLKLALELRQFAESRLDLHAGRHYLKYADLGRSCAVWNVSGAPEFSLEAKTWWYPLVGRLKYRGYFDRRDAEAKAGELRKEGFDASVGCVDAYSTLGFLPDPLLNTFIDRDPADLAELLFHELSHQKVFLSGDTDFNEAMATSVGMEGARQWCSSAGRTNDLARYEASLSKELEFVAMVQRARARLESLYSRMHGQSPETLRAEKKSILDELVSEHDRARIEWGGASPYDRWFAQPLNNALLNSVAAYYDLLPGFQAMWRQSGARWPEFFRKAKDMEKLKKSERRRILLELAQDSNRHGGPP